MWFDARAKLAEIEGNLATTATFATITPLARPVSQVSQVSQAPGPGMPAPRVAVVASVATPPARNPEPARADDPATFRHGFSVDGSPKTWTGCIVSIDAWRTLTSWEKHGPNGRHWSGITRQWENPDEAKP